MFSVIVDGEVLDFKYNRLGKGHYAFYIGDILIGQMFKLKNEWTAVCDYKPLGYPVNGFVSRYRASEFLLKYCGFWS
jgi:hypothetical protein